MSDQINGIRYRDYQIRKSRLYGEGQWELFSIDFGGFTESLIGVTNEALIPAFARKYGFLGYQQLRADKRMRRTQHARLNAKQLSEHLMKFRPYSDGEPLRWILAHARTMQRVLYTVTLLKEFRDSGDDARLREIRRIWKDGPFALRGELCDESVWYRTAFRHATEQWGLGVIDEFLGGNIRGLYPRVVFAVDGNPGIDFGFSAPIERAYFQLLEDLIGSRLRICKLCHKIFRMTDSRSEHCCKQHRQLWATRNFRAKQRAALAQKARKT